LKLELLDELKAAHQPLSFDEATLERLLRPSAFDNPKITHLRQVLKDVSLRLEEFT
jgi:endonuclease III-like uncharacterized protein